MSRFTDKTVIVTGAGSGIGAATAKRFSDEGANVVLVGRTEDKLEKTAKGLEADHTLVHPADVGDPKAVEALIAATVDRFGGIDTVVNNAGTAVMGAASDVGIEDWDKVLATNARGTFLMSRAAMPHLVKTNGSIVNVSSVSGIGGDWGMAVYNASKGAVTNLTAAMALDAGKQGVRVNAVCPTLTRTELTEGMFDNDKLVAKFRDRIALGRPADPEDIAPVIAFLASEDAGFVTGVNLPVDGGLSASNGQPNMGN